ncbi:NAD(P)H-binding protein [Streptomyces sp. NPDC048290]|uniref:NmrA family NAD(P)-binding protein n=1 Tax=Streptomyces sp. NPDC048290 TaxID=3155811 RepID=UPI0034273D98
MTHSMTHSKTVLVTGATGTVGRHLVARLLATGHPVRALTRDPATAELPPGVEVAAGNLGVTATLPAAFAGVGAAHLISFGDGYAPLDNAPGIVAAAVAAGVRRVTVLKGGAEKTPLDEALAASPLEVTALAPVEFMSNTLEWAPSVRSEGVVRDGFPGMPSSLVHEADIADVAAAVLTDRESHDGAEYWLTGPEALTAPERTAVLAEVLGRDIRFVALSEDEMVARWRGQGFGDSDIGFFLAMRTDPPEAGRTVLPTVRRLTGRPARAFADWVREHAAAFGG